MARPLELSVANYRCFTSANPARLEIAPGFTALIGPNNAGKSALLKALVELRPVFDTAATPQGVRNLVTGENGTRFSPPGPDPQAIFARTNNEDIAIEVRPPDSAFGLRIDVRRSGAALSGTFTIDGSTIQKDDFGSIDAEQIILRDQRTIISLGPLADAFNTLASSHYIPAFRNPVNRGGGGQLWDMTIGQAWIEQWDQWQSGDDGANRDQADLVVRDVAALASVEHLQIRPSSDGSTLIFVMNGRSFRLDEIGSGLAEMTMCLVEAAMRPRSLILIDEPESHLHAAVQTKFLRALGSYAEYGVVFATHSIGLARCMADRVYQVSALRQGESELAAFDSSATLSEVAGELAYAAQAELGSTALLLVEGPTDVRTFQELLRLFALEDRFVVLPLGGDGMVRGDRRAELEELQRITHRIAAVLDSERNRPDEGAKPHRLAFARTCDGLSMPIRCRVLDRRSIENYFTERAVRRVKGDRCRALGPFETLRGAGNLWDKAENWLIAREMQREELDNDLGDFLVSLQEL